MARDWRKTAVLLKEGLSLKSDPVGVSLSDSKLSLGKHATETTVCHMLLRSRHEKEQGVLHAGAADMRCIWGSAAMGLMSSPPRLKEGMLYLGFIADLEGGKKLHSQMGMIGDEAKRFQELTTFPLQIAPTEPDAVVMYMTPGRALRAIIAALHLKGGAITTPMTGQASVCASIARAVGEQKMSVDIPCIGDRKMGLVGDDELVVVIPTSNLDEFMLGLERTDYMARYPYTPYTDWSPSLPPMFTPMPNELE